MESTTLYFKEGSSDKIYQAAIEQQEAGYLVTFAYGRRGPRSAPAPRHPVRFPTMSPRASTTSW